MNILILNWRDPWHPKSGGAERVTMSHAKAWVKDGHTVTWFTGGYSGGKATEIKEDITFVRKGSSLTSLFLAPFYYFTHKKTIDIVIDEIHGLPYFTPIYVKKPKIAFIHEVAGEIWDYMYPFPLNVLGKIIEKVYFSFYKNMQFWTDAESMIDEIVAKGILRELVVAIPCPTDAEPLKNIPKKESIPTYIFVSRIVKMKGIEDVLKAFAKIKEVQSNSQLWVVGSGDEKYLTKLKKITDEMRISASTNFLGRVGEKEKLQYLRRAHLLLHASVKEGWGLVVLEAASQATPAVVYDVTGLRDTVIHHKTGVVVSRNTPETMAQEAITMMNDHKRYLMYQKNGLDRVKNLKWDTVTQQSIKLIKSVVEKKI